MFNKYFVIQLILLLLLITQLVFAPLPRTIPVGAIFSANQVEEQQAFHVAIEMFNTNLVPKGSHFVPLVKINDAENSFLVYEEVCNMLQQAPVAIFGPFNEIGVLQLQSICEHYEIPHIEARMLKNYDARADLSINMYPHQRILSNVFLDLIQTLEWNQFVIIYEDSDSIINFSQYLKQTQEQSWEVRIFQLQPDQSYREILWQVKETQIVNIVLDVKTEHITQVLKQAQQVGILSEKYKYIITSLDLHTLDLEDYRHSRSNITSLKIVQEQHPNRENWQLYNSKFDGLDRINSAQEEQTKPVKVRSIF